MLIPLCNNLLGRHPGFRCILRFPFATSSFDAVEELGRESISKLVQHEQWDDPRLVSLVSSSLAPIRVSNVVLELRNEPRLALKFFNWAGKAAVGFSHTTESYCLLAHILFCGKLYSDANGLLKELVSSGRSLPGFDVFEVLWSTRNVCVPGYGVFDALFTNCKAGNLSEALKLANEMLWMGSELNIVTYTALLDGLCKKSMVQEAIDYFSRMPEYGLLPNVAVYTALIDGLCKNNCIEAAVKLFIEMQDKHIIPDKLAYTALLDGYLKHGNFEEALSTKNRMAELGLQLDLHAYTSLVSGCLKCGRLQQARIFLAEMIDRGIFPDRILCISLLKKYYEQGPIAEAVELQNYFGKMGLIVGDYEYIVPHGKI
ncbi:Putative pentatricopeptide repeat-containing protein At2g02150 [Linum perenne]